MWTVKSSISSVQISDWGNVLIHHVCEWKHQKYSPWACPFSGVEFCGAFHFQKIIFLQLLQIWSSYCFHYDTDQLWMHTQSNNKTKCFKQSKICPPICAPFGTKSILNEWLAFISFNSMFLNIHRSGVLTVLFGCYNHGWCYMKLLLSQHVLQCVYTIQPCTVSFHFK